MGRGFERQARTFAALTLLSRVTGFGRDAILGRIFGAGPMLDAFNVAFQFPSLFRKLFGEGALSASFLPVYARLDKDDPAVARRFAGVMLAMVAIFLAGLAIAGEAILLWLSGLQLHSEFALRLMMIMLPYMPLVCLVALMGAMLQVHGRFGPTAASPIILNLCIMATAFIGSEWWESLGLGPSAGDRGPVERVAWSVMVAGLLQLAVHLWALRHHRVRAHLKLADDRHHVRGVVLRTLPMLLGLGVFQLNTFVDSLVASWQTMVGPTILGVPYPLREGSLTFLSYAQRLYEFPLGVFGLAVATAIFPALSRQAPDADAFAATLRRGVRLVVFIGLPASAGLMLVAEPLTAVILQGGAFSAEDTRETAWILLGYAGAVWAYSLNQVLVRAFSARGDSMTPVRIALGLVGLNLLLNVTLIWTPLRTAGLAWSTAICAIVQLAWLMRAIARRVGPADAAAPRILDHEVRRSILRSVLVTAAMAAATWAALRLLAHLPAEHGWWGSLATILILVGVGTVVVVAVARLQRMPELAWAIGRADRPG
ncbi:MAG: murein biosynthesis integral membrane protein MurJ, partial [Phycisphaerales bacterium]